MGSEITSAYAAALGEFTCVPEGWSFLDLYWGARPYFSVRKGLPEKCGAALSEHLGRTNEFMVCWIPFEELFIDDWDSTTVLVRGKAPACYAPLFGNGTCPFPERELLAVGVAEQDLAELHAGHLAEEPVDTSFGRYRHEISQLPPERLTKVTWRDSLPAFMRPGVAGAFRRLRTYGPDPDLRIVSEWG
jgi:hypothetical protein